MTKDISMPEQKKLSMYRIWGRGRVAGVLVLPLVLAACSSAPDWATPPDWANPIEWFDGNEQVQPTQVTSAANVVPAEGFPNLASVPGEAPQTSSGEYRSQVSEGLISDRNNAEYSNQTLTARSTLVPAAPPPSVPQAPSITPVVSSQVPATQVPVAPVTNTLPTVPQSVASVPQGTTVISSQGATLPPAFPNGVPVYGQPQYTGPTYNTPSWGSPYTQQGYAQKGYAAQQGYTGQSPYGTPNAAQRSGQLVAVIYFAHGSSQLNNQDIQVIRDVAALYGQRGGSITVLGHSSSRTKLTDALRHQQVNFDISERRADSVSRALLNSGVPGQQIVTDARSDSNPVFHEFMPTGEAGNRRVEIYVN